MSPSTAVEVGQEVVDGPRTVADCVAPRKWI